MCPEVNAKEIVEIFLWLNIYIGLISYLDSVKFLARRVPALSRVQLARSGQPLKTQVESLDL